MILAPAMCNGRRREGRVVPHRPLLLLVILVMAACGGKTERPGGWEMIFDGSSLEGWAPAGFEGGGEIKVDPAFRGGPGAIIIEPGMTLSGIRSTRGSALPRVNYEIELEAMRTR